MNELEQARADIEAIDEKMAALFRERMQCAASVAAYKKENGMPVLCPERERILIEKNVGKLDSPELEPFYRTFFQGVLEASRNYQKQLIGEQRIVIRKGCLSDAGRELNLNRRVLIVTDRGVPKEYAETVASMCAEPVTVVLDGGEEGKSLASYEELQRTMIRNHFSRGDCVVAVGGGVVGDLSGFAASTYMRGIDFYNIPTTVLSQVDSSVGGKTAVNLDGVKNPVGAFYQPKKVLIDVDLLRTLPKRQIANGLAEAVKMAVTLDRNLFDLFERGFRPDDMETVVAESVRLKQEIVKADEKEAGLRKVLNFGHTLGHGIEITSDGELLHGECVGLGMLAMCSDDVAERLRNVLMGLGLPVTCKIRRDAVMDAVAHDKKSHGTVISTVYAETPGQFEFRDMTIEELALRLDKISEEK